MEDDSILFGANTRRSADIDTAWQSRRSGFALQTEKGNITMTSVKTLALRGTAPLCFALALSGTALAQSANSQPSSPTELTQPQQLNQDTTTNAATDAQSDQNNANAATDSQSDQNNAQYQAQLQQYKASQANYEEQAARYEAARDRYIAANARYRRGAWPSGYENSLIVDTSDLLGTRVQTAHGHTVGRVEEVALASGHVDALRVTLDNGLGDVWIESADLRFDADQKVVMTDLDGRDLREMTHETY
jgi:hypothetical protein